MAINFPASPTNGQKFTSGATLYTYSTAKGAWGAAPLGTALPFNYLVNPGFQINQDGNAGVTISGAYTADQWALFLSTLTGGATRTAYSGGLLSPYYIWFAASVTKPALAVGDYMFLQQPIEGNRIAPLQWGTANAKPIVIAFSANTNLAGNYALAIRNSGSTRSYVAPIAMTATPQRFVIPIPGDTGGTWPSTTAVGMTVSICGATGTTYQTTQNSWQAGNFIGFTGMSNLATTTGSGFNFGQAGFYADPNNTGRAPPWECPMIRQDTFDCNRYWQKCMGAIGLAKTTAASTPYRGTFANHAEMRIGFPVAAFTGTMRGWDQATSPNLSTMVNYSSPRHFEISFGAVSGMTAYRAAMLIDASTTIFISQSARM